LGGEGKGEGGDIEKQTNGEGKKNIRTRQSSIGTENRSIEIRSCAQFFSAAR